MTDRQLHSRGDRSREWFEEWFDHPLYLQVYHHRDDEEATRCAKTILALCGLEDAPQPAELLDIACGAGRHALAFARLGYRVTANDLSPFLLDRARELSLQERLHLEFSRQDMRRITFNRQFDLIVQLFSSFGYFESERDDRDVIASVSTLLRPGGCYVLDLINPGHLERHFVPHTSRKAGSLLITEERTLTETHVTKRITVLEENGQEHSFNESVKLFSREETFDLLASEGFRVDRLAGDYNGGDFNAETSPRMMLFARQQASAN